ncbi:helix-turn-helix transcriptional regulator [Pengzhenrongella frigida]|uniref:HTH domain-containing protein n=1 Tax=Pengzhenrongella frigida TaxID=1259133 RepID=A0A4Q5N426_9MICO|nr:helix-turn-helix domain-containing protein [Cellulomonas sp. HLT2-17]RYV53008.1 HTH domain-containing protein [Cellulomonas sp. HLT2-17]
MPASRSGLPRRVLASRRRAELLQLLREHNDALSVAEIATEIGMHGNTVRGHLDALVESGHVERTTDARGTPGRPRQVYSATGAPSADRDYRLLADILTDHLAAANPDPGRVALAAGRSWALANKPHSAPPPRLAPTTSTGAPGEPPDALEPVLRMLSAAGFAPELAEDRSVIRLRHCPFRELAARNAAVVCQVHLGLIQGSLACQDTTVEATQIAPFVEPGLCLVTLTSASAI